MQTRSFPTHRNASGWQTPSQFLHGCWPAFVAAIQRDPGDAWKAIRSLPLDPAAREVFERAHAGSSDFLLPEDVLFPSDPFPFDMALSSRDRGEVTVVTVDDAEMLAGLQGALSGSIEEDLSRELAAQLREAGLLVDCDEPALDCRAPGIYRLQHAALLFRSETTTVLSDPVFVDDWLWAGALPRVDAIMVSHAHGDHFSLPSLMQFPRDTRIIVPRVERASMLADDMEALLRCAGFTDVVAPPWYSSVRVGDIEISVYPFYGEQPWATFSAPVAGLRNAGNTYLLDADGFKTWILIDAGHEHGHSMLDVARRVHAEHGDIDLVMSNLRVFPWHPGQIDGSGRFLFCYPQHTLADPGRWPYGVELTLGPSGVGRLLGETNAAHFLAYAHWWHSPGSGAPLVDGTPERALLSSIDASRSSRARLHDWGVGDRLRVHGRDVAIERFV